MDWAYRELERLLGKKLERRVNGLSVRDEDRLLGRIHGLRQGIEDALVQLGAVENGHSVEVSLVRLLDRDEKTATDSHR